MSKISPLKVKSGGYGGDIPIGTTEKALELASGRHLFLALSSVVGLADD